MPQARPPSLSQLQRRPSPAAPPPLSALVIDSMLTATCAAQVWRDTAAAASAVSGWSQILLPASKPRPHQYSSSDADVLLADGLPTVAAGAASIADLARLFEGAALPDVALARAAVAVAAVTVGLLHVVVHDAPSECDAKGAGLWLPEFVVGLGL